MDKRAKDVIKKLEEWQEFCLEQEKKECAKTAEQITNNMDGYYDFIKENWDEFKGGEYSDREIFSMFIGKAIREKE